MRKIIGVGDYSVILRGRKGAVVRGGSGVLSEWPGKQRSSGEQVERQVHSGCVESEGRKYRRCFSAQYKDT